MWRYTKQIYYYFEWGLNLFNPVSIMVVFCVSFLAYSLVLDV